MGIDAAFITGLILRLPVVLFALTVHEFMHGWVAYRCGDDTAHRAGRLTLNPLAHLDPIGTLCLIIGPIGWAKPVPVNPSNFGRPRRDDILVSGAGIAANFAMGIACALAIRFFGARLIQAGGMAETVFDLLWVGSLVNFGLGVFNLLPIPPLDGSHILQNLLPLRAAMRYAEFRRKGAGLLLAFIVGNMLLREVTGVSILGYPIFKLMGLFSGLHLG